MKTTNLFENLPEQLPDEAFDSLIETRGLLLERILSRGQRTPDGEWYDQDRPEWVILLKGKARLLFADEEESVDMFPGDYIYIPAHKRHRVEWTDPKETSVWLALHHRV